MKIEQGAAHHAYRYWTVRVDAGELVVDSGKSVPYPTTIGTIREDGKINVWTPAAYVPRGYRVVAQRMLESARDDLRTQGAVK